jgi:hypothetical protein
MHTVLHALLLYHQCELVGDSREQYTVYIH